MPAPAVREGPIKVLVVDDSAVVRQTMLAILGRSSDFVANAAADPLIAMGKIAKDRPDVIVLDLEMPKMDGMTFLEKIMAGDPIPVVVCSGIARSGSNTAMRALEAGAVEVVEKPQIGIKEFITDSAVVLTDAIKAAAAARLKKRRANATPMVPAEKLTADAVLPRRPPPSVIPSDRIAVVGASTGGTEALRVVLEAMPPDSPGVVIVQHMPELFTAAFANRLNDICRIRVKEAADGDQVVCGRALIAPGNHHLLLARSGTHFVVRVQDGPLVSRHRPSVDVLFRSAAQVAGPAALGVIMTGMGDDGARGLLEMKQSGARTIAQDEDSCVVFGMPKEAIARGAVDEVVPLVRIAPVIMRHSTARV
jgi:two-component system chemotaxis response regulator CheB